MPRGRAGGERDTSRGAHLHGAEGRAEVAIARRFRGLDHRRRGDDGTVGPDARGTIEKGDGAVLLVDIRRSGGACPGGEAGLLTDVAEPVREPIAASARAAGQSPGTPDVSRPPSLRRSTT